MRVTNDAGAHTRLTGAGVAHGSASSTWSSSGSNAVSARARRRVSCCSSSQSASSSRGSRLHSLPTGESRRISRRIYARIPAHLGKDAETCAGSVGSQRSRASPSSSELWTASAPTNRTGRAPVSSASTLSASVSAEMDRRDESRENSAHPSEMAAAHACRGRAQAL